jgi:hypothetical protein
VIRDGSIPRLPSHDQLRRSERDGKLEDFGNVLTLNFRGYVLRALLDWFARLIMRAIPIRLSLGVYCDVYPALAVPFLVGPTIICHVSTPHVFLLFQLRLLEMVFHNQYGSEPAEQLVAAQAAQAEEKERIAVELLSDEVIDSRDVFAGV